MITFDHVSKRFADGTTAVDDLTLHVPSGRTTVLLGPSGCGKTTSMRMVNRLVEPTSGTITVDGRDVRTAPAHELRRGIGYVIQQAGLFPHRTVANNITTVPSLLGWDRGRQAARCRELLDLVGLDQDVADRYPGDLSGGQQQRVGVARALAADPPVLLMDEPFGSVDPVRRAELQRQFRELQRDLDKTVLFITHDVDEAVLLGDQIAVMRPGGRLAEVAPTAELLAHPSDPFVTDFLGTTRGEQLLGLRSGADLPVVPPSSPDLGGWHLETDEHGRPTVWRSSDGQTAPVPVQGVGTGGTLRDLLDSCLTAPPRAATRVDDRGVLLGLVPWDTLAAVITHGPQAAPPADHRGPDVLGHMVRSR